MTLQLSPRHETVVQRATLVFSVIDRYARALGLRSQHSLGSLSYAVLGWIENGARVDFPEPFPLKTVRNSSGYDLFYDQVLNPDGVHLRFRLPENRIYVVRISGDYYQSVTVEDVPLPSGRTPYEVTLEPGYRYPFYPPGVLPKSLAPVLVRGSVQDMRGKGMGGVLLRLTYQNIVHAYVTDATGQWVIDLKPPAPLPLAAGLRIDFPVPAIQQGATVHVALVQADGTPLVHAPLVIPANQPTVNQQLQFP